VKSDIWVRWSFGSGGISGMVDGGGHPHFDVVPCNVEDHVIHGKRQWTMVGHPDIAKHGRHGIEIVEKVMRHRQARLGFPPHF
jgi:hypothetical protein